MAKILALCISEKKGVVKTPVDSVVMQVNHGIVGDAHAGDWHRQVSWLGDESAEKVRQAGLKDITAGRFAENVLTEGIVLYDYPVGTKIRVGDSLHEITQIGKVCHTGCAIKQLTGDCVMPREGVFTKVLEGGLVRVGDEMKVVELA